MFDKIKKYIKLRSILKQKKEQQADEEREKYIEGQYSIHKRIDVNLQNIKKVLGKNNDVIIREFKIGVNNQIKALLCCIDGLVNKQLIDDYVQKALMVNIHLMDYDDKLSQRDILSLIQENVLNVTQIKKEQSFDKVIMSILSGDTILMIDGSASSLIIGVRGWEARSIEQPDTEVTVRGSREGFTEVLRTNTSILRRKIKNPNLIFETYTLGRQTNTDIILAYIDGLANKKIIMEVKKRLERIDTDAILESGYIEQFIEDNPLSPFSTIGNSEKPDKIAAKLLEGRVAILCAGTPFVLTVPQLFIENFQVPEDYYSRPFKASFIRLLRLIAYFTTVTAPALYVALETYHQEMIPTVLLITASAAREGIPFPAFVEASIIGVMFEMLRESGVRLPRQVGQAVSIVGALIIGEAAIQAGIISAPMVIIAALTGITGFIIPSLVDSIIFFRLFLIALSAVFGLYGIILGLMIILAHICSLRSFGAPYLSPIAPVNWKGLKDTFIRAPLWLMRSRPESITWRNSIRGETSSLRPKKSDNDKGEES